MGFCHFKLKQHEKAIEAFARVLDLNPGSAIDYANIGSNYREMGEKDKAIYFYEIALSIDPSIDFARESLARLKSSKTVWSEVRRQRPEDQKAEGSIP